MTTHPRLSGTENESTSPRPLIWLILLALVLLVLAYQVALPQRIDIGAPKDTSFIHGFYFAENAGDTTFRWSGPVGQVSFNAVGGRPWQLRLRASGLRPAGPAPVDVAINGQIIATETWGGDMAEREYTVTRKQAGLLGNVKLALTAAPFVVPPDQRQLGLQVDWVELLAHRLGLHRSALDRAGWPLGRRHPLLLGGAAGYAIGALGVWSGCAVGRPLRGGGRLVPRADWLFTCPGCC